tara:strand:+ start:1628 stop:2671 length:1044 start_codon:yes stop_codon:yes gene_type:complete
MLEQALVDAAALKEAALKNAETAILERYAADVKSTMDSLLSEEEHLDMGMGMEPEDSEDEIPDAATAGEKLCPCPDDDEVKTYTFNLNDLRNTLDKLTDEEEGEPQDSEMLAVDAGAELEEEMELQEDLELDEELLFEYPEENLEEQEVNEEEILPEDIDIESLVEEVIVDLAGDELTGWAGRPRSDVDYAKDIRLARAASTEAKEQNEKLKAALEELAESSKAVANENQLLKQTLETMKEKLEEVNLSNAKLLYMNRTLNSPSLNERQRSKIVESIQNSDSVEEAKVIFETLQSAVGSSKRKPESLREAIKRPSISVPSRKNKSSQRDTIVRERFQRLAGISKTDT